jgi:hypothetical protein
MRLRPFPLRQRQRVALPAHFASALRRSELAKTFILRATIQQLCPAGNAQTSARFLHARLAPASVGSAGTERRCSGSRRLAGGNAWRQSEVLTFAVNAAIEAFQLGKPVKTRFRSPRISGRTRACTSGLVASQTAASSRQAKVGQWSSGAPEFRSFQPPRCSVKANPSFELTLYGRPSWPGRRCLQQCLRPGQAGPPQRAAQLKR